MKLPIKTKIRGVTHACRYTGTPRQKIVGSHVRAGTKLITTLEPDNPEDPNAVALVLESGIFRKRRFHLGYLSREVARDVAELLRSGKKLKVVVTDVTGGTKEKPTRGVNIVIR